MFRRMLITLAIAAGSVPLASAMQDTAPSIVDAKSSWGKRLNPTGEIPSSGFRAFYFDRNHPGKVVFQEDVDSIAIKYASDEFHRIDSGSFGAYWVGKLHFDSETTKQISVSQSWAKSRIWIDGVVVFENSNDRKPIMHTFAPGDHVIEVEFINNWHTVEYKVTVQDEVENLTEEQLATRLKAHEGKFAGVYYVGLYESARKDTSVDVRVPPTDAPVILWLTSYEAIDWNILSLHPRSTVIVSSYAPGSRVRGLESGDIRYTEAPWGIYRATAQCGCVAGNFHCEGSQDLNDVADKLLSVTGMPLSGYAAEYSGSVPTIRPYDAALTLRISAKRDADRAAQRQCQLKANPDFDTLMDGNSPS